MSSKQSVSRVANLKWERNQLKILNNGRWVWADQYPELVAQAKRQGKLVPDGDGWRIVPPKEWGLGNRSGSNSQYLTNEDPVSHTRNTDSVPGQKNSLHWLLPVGITLFILVLLLIAYNSLSGPVQIALDDFHYGRPRTYQVDVSVGHNDKETKSHFIAINLNKHIEIIEFPGGDPAKAHIFLGPVLLGNQDLAVVVLEFRDVNHDGKLDMLGIVGQMTFVFINDGSTFRPAKPGENIQLG